MKQLSTSAFTVVAFLFLVCHHTSAQQPTPTPRPEEPTIGSITGKVVSDSGQPLPGATVFIRAAGSMIMGRTTVSDIEGNFQINNLDSALYFVSSNAPAYISEQRDPDSLPVYYRIGDNIRLELIRGGVITGAVTSNSGEPVAGVRVRAQMIKDAKGQPLKGSFGTMERSTDDRGIYRLYGLLPGTYLVFAGGTGFQQYMTGPYDLDAPTYAPSSTRDNALEVVVRAGDESNIDIRYRGEAGRKVSGTVKSVGAMGASISLSIAGTGYLPVYTAFMQADSRGFALFGIPDGDYDVVAQQSVSGTSGAPNEFLMSEARRISVRGADISGLELITNPMASISGTVTLEPSKLPECQNKRRPAFTETIVDLVRNTKARNDEANFFRFYSNSTLPDKNGSFQIKNLRAGEYSFAPRFFARYWYIQSISIVTTAKPASAKAPPTLSKSDAGKNWLTIKSGDKVSGLSIVLAEGAASVRGQMTVPEGTRVPENLNVFAVPAEREKADDAMRFSTGNVLPDGSFALTNMAPGRYWILAQVTTDPELSLEKLRLPGAGESRVRLRRAAESAKTELELKPCQNLNDYKLPSTLQ